MWPCGGVILYFVCLSGGGGTLGYSKCTARRVREGGDCHGLGLHVGWELNQPHLLLAGHMSPELPTTRQAARLFFPVPPPSSSETYCFLALAYLVKISKLRQRKGDLPSDIKPVTQFCLVTAGLMAPSAHPVLSLQYTQAFRALGFCKVDQSIKLLSTNCSSSQANC